MAGLTLIIGGILVLLSLEMLSKSLRLKAKRNSLKRILLKIKSKILNFYRHLIGKKDLKLAGVRFNHHDKFMILILFGMTLITGSSFFHYSQEGNLASIVEVDQFLFKQKFSQVYEASNWPTRISDVIYNFNFESENHQTSSPERIGQIVVDAYASGGAAMFADPKYVEQGLMAKTTINNIQPMGEYIANFNLKIADLDGAEESVAVLEVFDTQENKYLAQREIFKSDFNAFGRYQNFEVPFTKTLTGNTQYRVLFADQSPLWLDKISVDPQFDNWTIYDPKIYFDNVDDEGGFSELVREAASLRDLRGKMVKIRTKDDLPAGMYTATYSLKTKNPEVTLPIARLEVYDHGPDAQYFSQTLYAGDFQIRNEFQDFDLEFEVTKQSRIEIAVFFFDVPESDLYIDRVKIQNF